MRRFTIMLGVALATYTAFSALVPNVAQAQVIAVQIARPYTPVVVQSSYYPPVYVNPPVVSYYPQIAPSYSSTIPVYPQTAVTYSYYAPPVAVAPAAGVYTTRTYYGYGIFRPRGYYNETTYTPYYP
jgi:hypothetical protein